MLNITDPADLANRMGVSYKRLIGITEHFEKSVRPVSFGKGNGLPARNGFKTLPPVRGIQQRLYDRVLVPNLTPSPFSHGGIKGRSIHTNADAHQGNQYGFSTDIRGFFPTIRHERVQHLFRTFGCSSNVAALCTRLCTYNRTLPQGFCTSTILADQVMKIVDEMIVRGLPAGVVYTRFVDDITLSGPFDFRNSKLRELVRRVLKAHGFQVNSSKEQCGSLADGKVLVTKVRAMGGRMDVSSKYLAAVESELKRYASARTAEAGPFRLPPSLLGKVNHICSLNPSRRGHLMQLAGYDPERAHARVD